MAFKDSVSIVVPTYEANDFLTILVDSICKMAVKSNLYIQLILVDDGSKDKTWEQITSLLKRQNMEIIGIRLSRNFGQHPATAAGLKKANKPFIAIMDCDLQDEPGDLPHLLNQLKKENADICYAVNSKSVYQKSNFGSKFFHRLQGIIHGNKQHVSTFRIFKSHVAEAALQHRNLSVISGPTIDRLGFKKTYVPCHRNSRNYGSRYTLRARIRLTFSYLLNNSKMLTNIFGITSIITFTSSLLYSFYLIFDYFFIGNSFPSGTTQLILLTLINIAILCLIASFVTMLLYEILFFTKSDPEYLVWEEIKT